MVVQKKKALGTLSSVFFFMIYKCAYLLSYSSDKGCYHLMA